MKAFFKNWLEYLDHDFSLSKRQVLFAIMALLIVGFGLRYACKQLRERQPRDAEFYIQTVENINNNVPYWFEISGHSSPLMPQIAAVVCRYGFTAEAALQTLNMIYATVWILVMFFLCRDVFDDDKAGLFGMTIATFNPYSARIAHQILREPLYILLFTVSVWCAVRSIRSKGGNLFYPLLLAILTILGVFTRFEGIEIGLLMPLAVIVIFIQYKSQRLRWCIYSLAVYMLIVGLIVGVLIKCENTYICYANYKAIAYYSLFSKID